MFFNFIFFARLNTNSYILSTTVYPFEMGDFDVLWMNNYSMFSCPHRHTQTEKEMSFHFLKFLVRIAWHAWAGLRTAYET